jgi:hypothetical protein
MNIKSELLSVIDALDAEGIEYALCEGLALAVHGHPRFTKDIDLLILEQHLPRLEATVKPLGFDLSSGWIAFGHESPTAQRIYRIVKVEGAEHLALDLVIVTPIQQPNWDSRQRMDLGDREIVVVSRQALIRMKRAAGRTQDLADIEKLEGMNDISEKDRNSGHQSPD